MVQMLYLGTYCKSGDPSLQAAHQHWSWPIRNRPAQQEVSLNLMGLTHPETIPPLCSTEKLSSRKPAPGANKVGDCCTSALDYGGIWTVLWSCHFCMALGSHRHSSALEHPVTGNLKDENLLSNFLQLQPFPKAAMSSSRPSRKRVRMYRN